MTNLNKCNKKMEKSIMRKRIILLVILTFLFLVRLIFAADFKAHQPFLITSAGQSPDALMVKILSQKAGLHFVYDKLAYPDSLKDCKTLILVCGGSTKGLGAANIDKEQELARINKLIIAAKKGKLSIIAMHVGGDSRRGKLSDVFNSLAAKNADCLIVLKDGDKDKFFSKIAEKRKIKILYIDKILDASEVLKNIFLTKNKN